ncbi:MAG TPA: cytosine permease [Steroidobacteraceae bacterium]
MSRSGLIEVHSIDYVPLAERHGKVWHLWPVWFMGSAHLGTVATGALGITLGLSLVWSGVAIILGCAFGTFFMAFHAAQGPQLGLPQMIQSRPQFGYMGALLVWVVAIITYIGFNALNQLLAAQTLPHLTGVDPTVSVIVFIVLAVVLAIVGYDWIHMAQRTLAYVLMAALAIFSIGLPIRFHGLAAFLVPGIFKSIPFLTQFFAAAAYQLSWSIYVSDYSRYLPKNVGVRAAFWWTYLGALLGGAWMMLVGAVVAALYSKAELAAAIELAGDLLFRGFGKLLLIASLLGLVTITSLNCYGASLTLLSIVDSFRPLKSTVGLRVMSMVIVSGCGAIAAAALTGNVVERFGDLLSVLLYLFTPWTAINLVDFYWVRETHYSIREIFNPHGIYGRWSWRGLSAYAAGFVAMIPFFSTGLYEGPIARALGGADVAMLVGLPVSALVYIWSCRSLDVAAEQQLVIKADAGLESQAAAS